MTLLLILFLLSSFCVNVSNSLPTVKSGCLSFFKFNPSNRVACHSEFDTTHLCPLCLDEKLSNECYYDCLPSTNYPNGHVYCDDCVKQWAQKDHTTCPTCKAKEKTEKVSELLKVIQGDFETKLNEIKSMGVILHPSLKMPPRPSQEPFQTALYDLIRLGIPLEAKDHKKRIIVRNAIEGLKKFPILSQTMIKQLIMDCIDNYNDFVLKNYFVKILVPLENVHPYLIFLVAYSVKMNNTLSVCDYIWFIKPGNYVDIFMKWIYYAFKYDYFDNLLDSIYSIITDTNPVYFELIDFLIYRAIVKSNFEAFRVREIKFYLNDKQIEKLKSVGQTVWL